MGDEWMTGDEGEEVRALRQALGEWRAPETPGEIEESLRRTFRSRRPGYRSPLAWWALAAAAACALFALVAWPRLRPSSAPNEAAREALVRESPSSVASRPSGDPAISTMAVTPSPVPRRTAAIAGTPAPARVRARVVPAVPSALLEQLARDLEGVKQVPPGVPSLLAIAPAQTRWEAVGTEWPALYRPI